jgi:hypothetical protein
MADTTRNPAQKRILWAGPNFCGDEAYKRRLMEEGFLVHTESYQQCDASIDAVSLRMRECDATVVYVGGYAGETVAEALKERCSSKPVIVLSHLPENCTQFDDMKQRAPARDYISLRDTSPENFPGRLRGLLDGKP